MSGGRVAGGMFGANTEELRAVAESSSDSDAVVTEAEDVTSSDVEEVRWFGSDATAFRDWYGNDVAASMVELAGLLGAVSTALSKQADDQDVTSEAPGIGAASVYGPRYGLPTAPAKIPSPSPASPSPAPSPSTPQTPTPPKSDPRMDEASGFAYDRMSEWTQSDQYRQVYDIARRNPAVFNEVLEAGIDARAGDPWAKAKLLFLGGLYPDMVWAAVKLRDLFQTGGVWDMKPYLAKEYGHPLKEGSFELSDSDGNRVRSDAYGNVAYGAMLANLGVSEEVALKAANAGGSDVGRGGDPLDDDAVRAGYDMVREYPGGMSREQFQQAIEDAQLHD